MSRAIFGPERNLMAMHANHRDKMHDFRRKHFEDAGTGLPKPDKVIEWSMLAIVELLENITTQLNIIQSKTKMMP
jgi:hypothetical protein